MEIKLNLDSSLEETKIKSLIDNYFTKFGFKKYDFSEQAMNFKKGTIFGNFIAFNPLNWKSEANIKLNKNESKINIDLSIDICTKGQMVLENEQKVWNQFVNNLKESLINGEIVGDEKIGQKVKSKNIGIIFKIVLVELLLGIIAGFIVFGLLAILKISINIMFVWVVMSIFYLSYEFKKNKIIN